MLKIVSKISALKIFYYLMSVDGVTSFEEEKFSEIGFELMGKEFATVKETIVASCENYMNAISIEDERYDVIQEGVDEALEEVVKEIAEGVTPRLLIWNMLSIAHCDDDYSETENRLIAHITRILQMDKSVFAEMKQLISTADSVRKEQEILEISDRPYSEIRPLMEEIERRKITIIDAAKTLIEDEIIFYVPETKEKKENIFVNAGKKIGDSMTANGKKIGETMAPVTKGAGILFSKIKDSKIKDLKKK